MSLFNTCKPLPDFSICHGEYKKKNGRYNEKQSRFGSTNQRQVQYIQLQNQTDFQMSFLSFHPSIHPIDSTLREVVHIACLIGFRIVHVCTIKLCFGVYIYFYIIQIFGKGSTQANKHRKQVLLTLIWDDSNKLNINI